MLSINYYKNVIKHLPNAYAHHKIVLDQEGKPTDYIFLDINQAFEKLTGLVRKEIINKRYTTVIGNPENEGVDWISTYGNVAITGESIELKEYSQDFNRWYNIIAYSDKPGYFTTIFNDITREKEREFKLIDKKRELREAQNIAKLGRWDLYHRENILKWADSVYKIFEKDPNKIHITYGNFLEMIHPDDRKKVNDAWEKSLITKEPYTIEHRIKMKDGSIKWLKEQCSTEFDESGDPIHSIGIVQDITEIKKTEESLRLKQKEIEHLSFYDHLTNLYNRRFFETELKRLNTKRNLPLSIIIGDVNGLKLLNDSFGHAVGDKLLIKMAEVMKKICRADDIIARIGGDEYAILLPQTSGKDAEKIIQRIQGLCEKERINGVEISISLGYATKTHMDNAVENILKKAEDIMYENKLLNSSCIKNQTMDEIIDTICSNSLEKEINIKRICRICKMR